MGTVHHRRFLIIRMFEYFDHSGYGMAYQARVAMDRIRFAVKHAEQFGPQTEPMREAGLQLLDALQRLETVDRRFQARSRCSLPCDIAGHGLDRKEPQS